MAIRAFPSSPRQREIQAEIKKRFARGEKTWLPPEKRKKNPVTHGADRLKMMQDAARLYREFTGEDGAVITKIPMPKIPKALAVMGEIDGIMYTTVRDGKTEKYVHQFKYSARPLFCVSPDGKSIFLIGGEYTFTERGIIDDT